MMNDSGLSPDGVVEAFCDAVQKDAEQSKRVRTPEAYAEGNFIWLNDLRVYTEYQGKGYGRRALRILTDLCDANGYAIKLVPRPLDDDPRCKASKSRDDLVRWYTDAGFVFEDRTTMIRQPCFGRAQ